MARHDFDPATVKPDGRPPAKASLFDGTQAAPWRGSVNGETPGTQVTVLAYGNDEPGKGPKLHIHPYDEDCTQLQIDRLNAVRAGRDNDRVRALLEELCQQAASDDVNLLPKTIELVKAKATLGEICGALRGVWGSYTEPMIV